MYYKLYKQPLPTTLIFVIMQAYLIGREPLKILVTGGTVFVSRSVAEYFIKKGLDVYVLNRNTRPQPHGAKLIKCDRHNIGDKLKDLTFDTVIDVTAYTAEDINPAKA